MSLKSVEYKYLVAGVFISGLFMEIMDTTVINVALPQLGRHFHAANNSLEWVVTGYLLSLAIWIPASGWVGDRVGTKKTFLFAMAAFTLGSALCGLSHEHRRAHRLPRPAGCRRRNDDAGRHRDAVPRLPAARSVPRRRCSWRFPP